MTGQRDAGSSKLSILGLMVGPWVPAFDNWIEMANRYRFEYTILGRALDEFVPYYTKWKCILDYVAALPEDRIVFYLDPLDAFVCDPPERILEKYLAYRTPLVIGAEKGPYPTHDFDVPDPYWRWGNTGMMIGRAGTIREAYERGYALEDWSAFGHVSDQHALIKYVLLPEHLGSCTVDYRRTLVANLSVSDASETEAEFARHGARERSSDDLARASSLHFFAKNKSGYNRFARLYGLRIIP